MSVQSSPSSITVHSLPIDEFIYFRWDFFGMFANECGAVISEKCMYRLKEYANRDPYGDCIDSDNSDGWSVDVLSNGGAYWFPCRLTHYTVKVDENHFCDTLSAKTAGIIMTLLTLHHVGSVARTDGADRDAAHLDKQLNRLLAYVAQHPEASTIKRAIASPVWEMEIAND
ncbi:antirestriction protein [Rouxiella badensis]|uniref:antirestriction protein n=1 Tax=Rouxiella badensis TaxID=1646377 RepID=UPI0017880D16|nr:antirestriction protein [Rouxiella badensis]QOI57934.1 antirestriction protein [Rouxiella badensis subsp. acadiensis]